MKVQEFLYQVRKLAGDEDGNQLSTSLLLTYLTEEMGSVAALFPRQESFEEDLSGNAMVALDQAWIDPQFIYLDNFLCEKMYATEILRMVDDSSLYPNCVYWGVVKGIINLSRKSGTARVIGNWRPDEYTETTMHYEMAETTAVDATALTIPALTGKRLAAVRYRMLSKCAEELQSFDRAQYYLQMGERAERDLRNTIIFESTVDISVVHGTDF